MCSITIDIQTDSLYNCVTPQFNDFVINKDNYKYSSFVKIFKFNNRIVYTVNCNHDNF